MNALAPEPRRSLRRTALLVAIRGGRGTALVSVALHAKGAPARSARGVEKWSGSWSSCSERTRSMRCLGLPATAHLFVHVPRPTVTPPCGALRSGANLERDGERERSHTQAHPRDEGRSGCARAGVLSGMILPVQPASRAGVLDVKKLQRARAWSGTHPPTRRCAPARRSWRRAPPQRRRGPSPRRPEQR